MPLVSVLIPVYNAGKFLCEAVDSILEQTYQDFEILIYDDGSTDNCLESLKKYDDKRINVMQSDKNRGVSFARNVLLDSAAGELIMYQDADDYSHPKRMERLIEQINKGAVFVCSFIQPVNINGQPIGRVFGFEQDPKEVRRLQTLVGTDKWWKPLAGASCMFKRDVIDIGISYDVKFFTGEDVYFEAMIQSKFPYKMWAIPNVLYFYRKYEGTLTYRHRYEGYKLPKDLMNERNKIIRQELI